MRRQAAGWAEGGGYAAIGWRPREQAVIAGLLTLGLLGAAGNSAWHASRQRLVEIDRAAPRVAPYQLDVNRSSWEEWILLPRIGESTARRIVAWREQHGPIRSVDELREVRGIGPKTLERMRPYLSPPAGVSGPGSP